MKEQVWLNPIWGEVSIVNVDTGEVLLKKKNVIVNGVSWLFARMFLNPAEPLAGVWGLSVGQGGTGNNGWSSNQQPAPVSTVTQMVSELKRKQLNSATFVDGSGNPTTTLTTSVKFTTLLNATTDGITTPIREMGLIGGGTTLQANGGPTNMLTAPYFDPTNPLANTVLLINYFTLPPFILPPGVNMAIVWQLNF